jgi:oligopeptide transport system substrate-binding protein
MRIPAFLFLPLLVACSATPPGGDLAVAVVGSGPMAEELADEASRATLVTRAAAGDIAPGLATSWRFLDEGNDLILRLAPVRWPGKGRQSGAELVAADVVLSLRRGQTRARGPVRSALAAAGLAARGTARAPISRVVELAPRPPTPHLLDWLAEPALAVVDRRGRAFAGAYDLARDAGSLRLSRRGDMPRADAQAASIILHRLPADAAIAQFAARRLQLVLGEGLSGLSAARTAGQGRALRVEAVRGVIGLAVQSGAVQAGGALADARLRRALLLAADGAALADRIALAALVPQRRLWDGLPPPGDDRARPLPERQALAATLLAEAGLGPQAPLALALLVPPGPEFAQLGDELARRLGPLGIALRMVRIASNGTAPRHDLALVEQIVRVPDALVHLERWRCGRARPCSAAADAQLDEARAAGADLSARLNALDRAEAALMTDPAFIPLLRPVRWSLVAPGVSGFTANALGWHPLGRIAASQ